MEKPRESAGTAPPRVQRTARVRGDVRHTDGVAALLREVVFGSRAEDDLRHADWLWGGAAG